MFKEQKTDTQIWPVKFVNFKKNIFFGSKTEVTGQKSKHSNKLALQMCITFNAVITLDSYVIM